MQLLSLLLSDLGISDELTHAGTGLGHLQNLLLLLRDVRVQFTSDSWVQHSLLVSDSKHGSKLGLDSLQLIHFIDLLLLHLLMFQQLLSLLQYILTHLHSLFKILIPILQDLLKRLLVHLDHLLLVFKHLGCLILLINHPVRLCRHLLI